MVASDKLFFWLFQHRTDRLQPLVASLPQDMEGFTFSAQAIKEREVRLDGLFLRHYTESGLLLMHQHRQDQPIRH